MKSNISYGMCSIKVSGMDMTCPFCLTLVKSGQHHQCSPAEITVKPIRRKKTRRSPAPNDGKGV